MSRIKYPFSVLPGGTALACAFALGCGAEPAATSPDVTQAALGGILGVSGPARLGGSTAASAPTTLPTYGGGAILQPEIVSLYWGTFTQAQRDTNQTYLQNLAFHISGSTAPVGQEPAVFQYGVRGAKLGATWNDTTLPNHGNVSGHAVDADVRAKISALQALGHLPAYNAVRVFMVFTSGIFFDNDYCTAPGADSNCFCAYHSAAGSGQFYAVDPFPYDGGGNTGLTCGAGGFGSLTVGNVWQSQTSHELFEAATDPSVDSSGWTPEIGDQCNWPNNTDILTFGAVERVVDKIGNACSIWTAEQVAQISSVVQHPTASTTAVDLFGLGDDHSLRHRGWTSTAGWQPAWDNLGGTFTSPPVAVAGAGGAGTLDVFAQGTDNSFYHKAWNGSAWVPAGATNWDAVGGNFNGQPAVVSWGVNRIDVFGQGTDGSYYHKAKTGSTWPATWDALSGTFNGPPTAITRGVNSIDIFGRGIDGAYYHKFWNGSGALNGVWEAPFSGNRFISEPVVATTSNGFGVVGQGTDAAYYAKMWISSSGWQTLESVGGTFMGPPAAISQGTNARFDVIGQGTDGAYYHRQRFSGVWQTLEAVHGSGFGAGALDSPANSFDLFIEGTDHAVYFKTLTDATWSPASTWNSVGGSLH